MQQAAHITHGLSLRPLVKQALLQYLLSVYVADTETRKLLQLPKPDAVDFKASCFCHKKAIDIGYVCSVCLSIFCQPTRECSTCSTKFG
jgi:transcription initiation factor TFIIH subunit 3